ncbi:hypothetical protein [Burkholderia cepacia]|uniref:hypothetical protein n=1 Tax=Burkholderia cepacia TaxID=292 RepID=UPI000B313C8A|nr:hypothetical protein [Burkholderia cepacia]
MFATVKNYLGKIIEIHRMRPAFSAIVWGLNCALMGVVCLAIGVRYTAVVIPILLFSGAFVFAWISYRNDGFEQRIAAADAGLAWDVYVNGVVAGRLADSRYAAITRDVFFDVHQLIAQVINYVHATLQVALLVGRASVFVAFWLAAFFIITAPQKAVAFLHVITGDVVAGNPSQLASTVVLALLSVVTLAAIWVITTTSAKRFGYVDMFDRACAKAVRQAISCAADGSVFLARFPVANAPGSTQSTLY